MVHWISNKWCPFHCESFSLIHCFKGETGESYLWKISALLIFFGFPAKGWSSHLTYFLETLIYLRLTILKVPQRSFSWCYLTLTMNSRETVFLLCILPTLVSDKQVQIFELLFHTRVLTRCVGKSFIVVCFDMNLEFRERK